jgi:hypothetical protein
MEYKRIVDKKTRALKIIVTGDPSELYKCGRVIVDIVEGSESNWLRSKFDSSTDLSSIIKPSTVAVGNSDMELFTFSANCLEYSLVLKGHSKEKHDAVRSHYVALRRELQALMKYFNGKPTEYHPRSF